MVTIIIMLPYIVGGGLPVVRDGGSLDGITFSAGSVTLQITVLYRFQICHGCLTLQVHLIKTDLPYIKINFFLTYSMKNTNKNLNLTVRKVPMQRTGVLPNVILICKFPSQCIVI